MPVKMVHKFSFDIPRLKISTLRPDQRLPKNGHASPPLDSPVEQPKSVRPPLSPHLEAELRTACAYVLQNFKPSHQIYEEQFGGPKPQLDYAAIKGTAQKDGLQVDGAPLSKANTNAELEAEPIDPERFRYKPDVKIADLFKQDASRDDLAARNARARAEQLMAGSLPSAAPAAATTSAAAADKIAMHRRSKSTPQPGSAMPEKKSTTTTTMTTTTTTTTTETVGLQRGAIPRTDSTDTTGSTPFTDRTDYPWSNSTAPTSAAITPARSSKRTSSQAFQAEPESTSVPKVEPVDAEWMRKELDKHKRVREEAAEEDKEEEGEGENDEEEREAVKPVQNTNSSRVPASMTQMPGRKPLPVSRPSRDVSPSADTPGKEPVRADSRQEERSYRPESRQARDALAPAEHDEQRSASQRTEATVRPADRLRSRASSVTRNVVQYFRPENAPETEPTRSRRASKVINMTREVQKYFRSGTANASRRPSVDATRNQSVDASRVQTRSQSRDSFHSVVSGKAGSTASSNSKWRPRKPWQNGRFCLSSNDVSRPDSASSNSRGRPTDRSERSVSPPKMRKPVNLNRDLPPLPSLDSWKDAKQQQQVRQTAGGSECLNQTRVPSLQPEDVVALYGGDTPSPEADESSKQSGLVPTVPAPVKPPFAQAPTSSTDTLELPDQDYPQLGLTGSIDPSPLAPTTTIDPSSQTASKQSRRRSQSILGTHPPLAGEGYRNKSVGHATGQKSPSAYSARSAAVNYSRPAGGPVTGLRKATSRDGHLAPTAKTARSTPSRSHSPRGHSRQISDDSERTGSTDSDYRRMHDLRYRHVVEISATPTKTVPQIFYRTDKTKRHWWNMKDKKAKEKHWMDEVIRSGSRSGVLLTDEVAGAPIVRY